MMITRNTLDEVKNHLESLQDSPLLNQIIKALPELVMILNENRQIIMVNDYLLKSLGLENDKDKILALRPGEALGCINSDQGPDGCGTGPACQFCGAFNSINHALVSHGEDTSLARLSFYPDSLLKVSAGEFRITSTWMKIEGTNILFVVLKDVSAQQRRAVLEQTFFHDILNTASGIRGISEVLTTEMAAFSFESRNLLGVLSSSADMLVDEIHSQQTLLRAERGDLSLDNSFFKIRDLLDDLYKFYAHHFCTIGKELKIKTVPDFKLHSDRTLVRRVLSNMIKNALEASSQGDSVTVEAVIFGDKIHLKVHNSQVMPEEVKAQVFQRSFSTKARTGRGIGTFSMKILGEKYLGGKVSFTSIQGQGTTFDFCISNLSAQQ